MSFFEYDVGNRSVKPVNCESPRHGRLVKKIWQQNFKKNKEGRNGGNTTTGMGVQELINAQNRSNKSQQRNIIEVESNDENGPRAKETEGKGEELGKAKYPRYI